ncbi:MAG: PKD domain-containing protein [Bacteroidetes bacterium]|nr:PKD domain-containing protein [Bacteroidota bacterium]
MKLFFLFCALAGAFFAKGQTASFTIPAAKLCGPNTPIQFTNTSTGVTATTTYFWDFGNGQTSPLANPNQIFSPGPYTVTLTINVNGVISKASKDIIVNQNPIVKFTASDTAGCFPLTVQFDPNGTIAGAGTATVTSWSWDFGDGSPFSTQKTPTHIYRLAAAFTVTLTVVNSDGCKSSLPDSAYIKIPNGVIDTFSIITSAACKLPITLNTNNLSSGPGSMTYTWDFGDGTPPVNALNTPHTYNTPNTYNIKLIAVSSKGCSDSLTIPTQISGGNVQSNFTPTPDTICVNGTINFANISTPKPTNSTWDFGNGTSSNLVDPLPVTYTTANTFPVKLTNIFGACIDSVIKNVVVLNSPLANFSASPTIGCDPVFTVNFTDQSTGASSWLWNFGDGTTSNLSNPVHTYQNYGTYQVSLQVANGGACSNMLPKPMFIRTAAPNIKLDSLNSRGCRPFTYTPSIIGNPIDGIKSYNWSFGDGTTSTSATPGPHLYSNAGVYVVKLTITTNGGCTATAIDTVKVGTIKPVVTASANPTSVCVGNPVNFTGSATNNPDQWFWTFGDGGTSTQPNTSYTYKAPGNLTATLRAYVQGCNDSAQITIKVNPPLAKFGYTYTCNSSNTPTFNFVDSSIGADISKWDFGDGTIYTNPTGPITHTFTSGGPIYTVTLTVTNNASGCTNSVSLPVKTGSSITALSASPSKPCVNSPVVFSSTGINPADFSNSRWYFDFGDGDTSGYDFNSFRTHIYTKPGSYTATVIITNVVSHCNVTGAVPVVVSGPIANFNANDTSSCTSYSAIFNDLSIADGTHAITSWTWDFGDGSPLYTYSSKQATVSHPYTKQGIYTVKLIVTDASGCTDSLVKTNYITVSLPSVAFTTLDSLSCPGSPIQFVNNSKGYGLTYQWHFGDATPTTDTSSSISPTHIYPIGSFKPTLTITDQFGCTLTTNGNYNIRVDTPYAAFHLVNPTDTFASCPPLNVGFVFTGSYYKSLKWIFGDGGISSIVDTPVHSYALPGNFTTGLIVTSHGGCTDTASTINIRILGPVGSFTYSPTIGCHTLPVNFTLQSSSDIKIYTWIFSPTQSRSTNVPHYDNWVYDSIGVYTPYVVLQDTSGCNVPIKGDTPIIVSGSRPNFTVDKPILCDSGTVQFTSDTANMYGTLASQVWDFGDGQTVTALNPSHIYSSPGLYPVKLVNIMQPSCPDSITKNDFIKVVASPSIGITGDSAKCVPATMNFQGVILKYDSSAFKWNWVFGNGKTDTTQIPPAQIFPVAGPDTVKLTATNSSGCATTVSKPISIDSISVTNAGPDTAICLGTNAYLHASSSDPSASFQWLPPANGSTLSCTVCYNPVVTAPVTTTFYVQSTNVAGCPTMDSVVVTVVQPSTLNITPSTDSLCLGQSVQLFASGQQVYAWTPAAGLSNPSISNPIARPDTTTTYTVTASDSLFCFPKTASAVVSVFKYPTVSITPHVTDILVGGSYQITATASADVDSINWMPTIGLSCTNCLNPLATPTSTTIYKVNVLNNGNCPASDSIKIIVLCNGTNLFVPNTFSPNGDGVNDWFYVQGKGLSTIQSLRIFDRWGEMVFEKKDFTPNVPEQGWDGNFKGKKAPSDVYVYTLEVVCENSQVVKYNGNVALVR